jgi:hypothetical protein
MTFESGLMDGGLMDESVVKRVCVYALKIICGSASILQKVC